MAVGPVGPRTRLNGQPKGVTTDALHVEGLDRVVAARVMGVVYVVCGGAVAVIAAAVPQPAGSNLAAMEGICISGVVLGPLVWMLPWERWPRVATLALAVVALGFISGFDAASAADGFRYGLFDVVVFAWVGLSQARGTSVALVPFLVAGYVGPLVAAGHGWDSATASVFYAVPSCIVTGEAVAWMADRLRRTQGELVSAQEALVQGERLSAVGEMATVIGHELRNPLGAVTNAHYLIRSSLGDPEQVEQYLDVAEREVTRAVRLAEDLALYMRERELERARVEDGT